MIKKISKKELYLYILAGVIALGGLTLIVLGIVADHVSVNSDLYKVQANFSWRYLGLIIFTAGVILAGTILLLTSKKIDRVADRQLRRKQRLSAMMSDAKDKEHIVVSNGKIVSDIKAKEDK